MKNKFWLIILLLIIMASTAVGYEMGYKQGYKILTKDGSTMRKAIVIEGTYGERIINENFKIENAYGARGLSWTIRSRKTVKSDIYGKVYDVVVVDLKREGEVTFYFDITTPYVGKYGTTDLDR